MFSEISFNKAISHLSSLNECKTPLQMAYLIQEVVEEGIIATIESFLKTQGKLQDSNADPITTDDLIPITAYVISQSDYNYYHSTLFYIENFIFADISPTKLGFILINFRAAITFMSEETKEVTMDQPLSTSSMRGVSRIVPTLSTSSFLPDSPTLTNVQKLSPEPTSSNGNAHSSQDSFRGLSNLTKAPTGARTSLKLSNPTSPPTPSFQRPPEVILVNQNQNVEVLSYLKSLQNQ